MIGLTYIREKSGLSMEQFGEKLGVSKQTLSLWEGKKLDIPKKRLQELTELFKMRSNYFINEVDDYNRLQIDYAFLQNKREELEKDENFSDIEEIDKKISDLWQCIEVKENIEGC